MPDPIAEIQKRQRQIQADTYNLVESFGVKPLYQEMANAQIITPLPVLCHYRGKLTNHRVNHELYI